MVVVAWELHDDVVLAEELVGRDVWFGRVVLLMVGEVGGGG